MPMRCWWARQGDVGTAIETLIGARAMANGAADWLHQGRQDLDQKRLSATHGHHEWAHLAPHQAVEKALKDLHLNDAQQVCGHGLGRLLLEVPDGVRERMEARIPELVKKLRILDALHIPTRDPDSLPDGAPAITSGVCRARMGLPRFR